MTALLSSSSSRGECVHGGRKWLRFNSNQVIDPNALSTPLDNDTHARKKKRTVRKRRTTSHIEVCSCQSSRLQPQRSTKRCSRRRGQWSIGAPSGAGTDDGCRFGVVSEFERRIDADHLLGTCARCSPRVAPCQKSKPKPSLLLLRLPTTRILIHSFSYVWMLPTTQLKSY